MTKFSKWLVAALGLALAAAYCFLGALQNASFAVAGVADPQRFHGHSGISFAAAVVALVLALASGILAVRARRASAAAQTRTISGATDAVYVETDCCLVCGIPWTLAPEVFGEGTVTCIVKRQPSGATELRRVLRVFRTQDVGCIRYGGRNERVLAILRRAGCVQACDHDAGQ